MDDKQFILHGLTSGINRTVDKIEDEEIEFLKIYQLGIIIRFYCH